VVHVTLLVPTCVQKGLEMGWIPPYVSMQRPNCVAEAFLTKEKGGEAALAHKRVNNQQQEEQHEQ
jgi:hypothetical protein